MIKQAELTEREKIVKTIRTLTTKQKATDANLLERLESGEKIEKGKLSAFIGASTRFNVSWVKAFEHFAKDKMNEAKKKFGKQNVSKRIIVEEQ